jgi:hypothetical protein
MNCMATEITESTEEKVLIGNLSENSVCSVATSVEEMR